MVHIHFNENVLDPDVEIHNSRSYQFILPEKKFFDYFIKGTITNEIIIYFQ
jgi:hypothetical protein